VNEVSSGSPSVVGLISDTHGLLRPQAVEALRGSRHIIHAGDVGAPEVLEGLGALAPVTAIRGNNDHDAWARRLPLTNTLEIHGVRLYVIHDIHMLDVDLQRSRVAVVIAGHSHRPDVSKRDGVLVVNPGSAGPRRFRLPVSVACLTIAEGRVNARLITLDV